MNPLLLKPQIILPHIGRREEQKQYDSRVAVYDSKSSWQTTNTWYQWIKYIAALIHEHIKEPSMILVDSFAAHFAHPTLHEELKEYEVYLHPLVKNATQFIQPMDQNIIPKLKSHIRS